MVRERIKKVDYGLPRTGMSALTIAGVGFSLPMFGMGVIAVGVALVVVSAILVRRRFRTARSVGSA